MSSDESGASSDEYDVQEYILAKQLAGGNAPAEDGKKKDFIGMGNEPAAGAEHQGRTRRQPQIT